MILFPNCKINLGLNILRKREDGYHDLETMFYPLPLQDVVEIVKNNTTGSEPGPEVDLEITGLHLEGSSQDNLCVKAYYLLKKDFPHLSSIRMHLHKAIPAGAGLGGGSSDAVFVLKLLDKKFYLNLSDRQLNHYALLLGSDCPFFLLNKPCLATGRGEILQEIKLSFPAHTFMLVHPGVAVRTGWAFSQLKLREQPEKRTALKEIITRPLQTWKEDLVNDFEEPVFAAYPEIRSIRDKLYDAGAAYASMSGSGSAVFGIFDKKITSRPSFPAPYLVKELTGE